jgi:Spy/CpxP family protein refolding chaperone
MKNFFTSALVLALAIGSAHAQTTSTDKNKDTRKEHKARKAGHDKMYDQLNLSAEQKTKLQALREDYKKQLHELNNNTTLSKEQKLARRKELHLQHKAQVSSILTPAQREQAGKIKADWKSKEKAIKWNKDKDARKGDATGRAKKGTTMQQDLNLTQDQQAKMQQIRTDYRSKFEALHNDKALTQEQKKVKMQELMQAQQAQMKSILTKEQAEKMEAQRKEQINRNTK